MKNPQLAALLLLLGTTVRGQTLDLPPRPPTAPKGRDFAHSITSFALKEREERIRAEIEAGNVPTFLRKLVPVTVSKDGTRVTYDVTPDYLAVGSDDDYFLTPLSPPTAQALADRLGCVLPTTRMVDQIYAGATIKLTPAPIPPTPAMTTVPVFLRHNETVADQRKGKPLGELVAGHKKDVVITNKLIAAPGKVAIYGWHEREGKPIQPLYTGHTAAWVDYSHGIRLVSRKTAVNGAPRMVEEVLADPQIAPLLSAEGVVRAPRYPLEAVAEPQPAGRKVAAGEVIEELHLDRGVRIVIDRPEASSAKPVLLVFYALPNGNTIEQTIGKPAAPGDDWHFDIQHIGAQTRFLREKLTDRTVIVAYLENDLKSWPAWRKRHGDEAVPAVLAAVTARFEERGTRIVLSGHSGGGSLIFGYINTVSSIPDRIERIAFLDANYAYDTTRHRDKLTAWLKASDTHHLAVLAYNDAVALLNGKSFVSAAGGTWGRSHLMLNDLETSFPLQRNTVDGLERIQALDGRLTFLLKENPDRKILHTVQVERNGFIEGLLTGTAHEGSGYTYLGDRAYTRFIRAD